MQPRTSRSSKPVRPASAPGTSSASSSAAAAVAPVQHEQAAPAEGRIRCRSSREPCSIVAFASVCIIQRPVGVDRQRSSTAAVAPRASTPGMAWEEGCSTVLDDLEQQAEAIYDAERSLELADRARAAYADVSLASRLMAATGHGGAPSTCGGPELVSGRLERVGRRLAPGARAGAGLGGAHRGGHRRARPAGAVGAGGGLAGVRAARRVGSALRRLADAASGAWCTWSTAHATTGCRRGWAPTSSRCARRGPSGSGWSRSTGWRRCRAATTPGPTGGSGRLEVVRRQLAVVEGAGRRGGAARAPPRRRRPPSPR